MGENSFIHELLTGLLYNVTSASYSLKLVSKSLLSELKVELQDENNISCKYTYK